MLAKSFTSALLSFVAAVTLAGCVSSPTNGATGEDSAASQVVESAPPLEFATMDDPELLRYMEDGIYADLEAELGEDYIIENVTAAYAPFVSEEYKQELAYNSQENLYFGYTLSELDRQFQGTRYVFTADENGKTIVKEFEAYDDAYDQAITNVAIGAGVLLVCVTVSAVSGGAGAAPVTAVFAAAAKTGTIAALSSGAISGAAAGAVRAYETGGDMEAALREAALKGGEGFKWGAITGVLAGGVSKASALRNPSKAAEAGKRGAMVSQKVPTPRESELAALQKFGGREQVTFLNGKEVAYGTMGGTRPDIVRNVGGKLEAIEVKNYDLEKNLNGLCSELKKEVVARVTNLPKGSQQRVVLDVTGRGYDDKLIESVKRSIWSRLDDVYPNILIEIMV